MFVTLKVFKLIGPSNDGRRHGRGTYLFIEQIVIYYNPTSGSFRARAASAKFKTIY
jgi:hypothetical protein